MESVTFSHGDDCLLVSDSKLLNSLLNVILDGVQQVGMLLRGILSVFVNWLTTLLPHVVSLQVWQPLHFVNKLVSETIQFVLVSLLSEIYFEVVLTDGTVYTSVLCPLNIELSLFFLISSFFIVRHLVCYAILGITRLVLDLRAWTWSSRFISSFIFVVWQQPLQSIVTHVLLLLQQTDLMIDDSMNVIKLRRSHLWIRPPDQELVLFVL